LPDPSHSWSDRASTVRVFSLAMVVVVIGLSQTPPLLGVRIIDH